MKTLPNAVKIAILYLISLGSGILLYHAWQQSHPAPSAQATRPAAWQAAQTHAITKTRHVASTQNPIRIQTDVLDLSIQPVGGVITSAKLRKFTKRLDDASHVRILSTDPAHYYTVQSGMMGNHSLKFSSARHHYVMGQRAKQLDVVLTAKNAQGVRFTKTYTFRRGQYAVDVTTAVHNDSHQPWIGHHYTQIKRRQPPKDTSSGIGRNTYNGMSYFQTKKPYTKLSYSDMRQRDLDTYQQGGWVAGQQHYFLTAWIANPSKKNHVFSSYQRKDGHYLLGMIGPEVTVNPQEHIAEAATLYIGPERVDVLHGLAKGLDLTIDYGWLWFISKMLMWLMTHIHAFVGNWGLSIILVTVVVKLAFFRMSTTSFRSMARMSEIAPKVKALQEKYGDDKAQLQRETMALYSKEKINPLGGCLPLLIQLPFFIGLYWALIESIDLRQAPFVGWIHDLSVQDPYFVLPILMGISMLVQQMMSKNPAQDANQQKVMMLLPVFFTFIFIHFPAGLILYMITNNVLSVAQQEWAKRTMHSAKHTPRRKAKS